MIVYSISTSVIRSREQEWLKWMHEIQIPAIMQTGYMMEFHVFKLLHPNPDPNSVTYNVQYIMESLTDYHHYSTKAAPGFQEDMDAVFGQDALSFRTILRRES